MRVDEDRLRVAVADAHCEVGVTPRAERAVPAHPRIELGTLARADSAANARRTRGESAGSQSSGGCGARVRSAAESRVGLPLLVVGAVEDAAVEAEHIGLGLYERR